MADNVVEDPGEKELVIKKAKLGATEIKNVKQSLSASNLVSKSSSSVHNKPNALRKSLSATKLPLTSPSSPSKVRQQRGKENDLPSENAATNSKDEIEEKDKDAYSFTLSSSSLSMSSTSSAAENENNNNDNSSSDGDEADEDVDVDVEEENEDSEMIETKDGADIIPNKTETHTNTTTEPEKAKEEVHEHNETTAVEETKTGETNKEERPQKAASTTDNSDKRQEERVKLSVAIPPRDHQPPKSSTDSLAKEERRTRRRERKEKEKERESREIRSSRELRELRSPRRSLSTSSHVNPYFANVAMAPAFYSPQARLYISQYPFQPHHANVVEEPTYSDFLQGGTFMADFAVSPAYAIECYKDWKQSLWFAPESFLGTLDPLALTPLFLPCFDFSLFTHTVQHGKAGYIKPESESQFGFEYQWAEGKKTTFAQTQHHPEALAYAPVVKGEKAALAPPYELIEEIWYWKIERLRQQTAAESQGLPHKLYYHQTKQFEVNVVPPSTVLEAWTHALRRLRRNEEYIADYKFKREFKCDVAADVTTETRFSHIVVKLIYLPVYVWAHNFEGAKYYTLMNGQNGLIHGTRPYRLKGSFDSALKVLTGSYMSYNNCAVVKGTDLATKDGFLAQNSPYEPHLSYIVFPPSDQLLVLIAVGWVRVRNTSSSDAVVIAAQKRLNPTKGKKLVLEPGAEHIISYRGAWCFCVTKGDPHSVVIAHVSTNSGSKKNNIMGMV